ncbi:hypothetical protein ACP4OV_030783 [Aristida adscensionis]
MAPGRGSAGKRKEPAGTGSAAATCIDERLMATKVIRNNKILQSLGVNAVAALLNGSIAQAHKGNGREESDPLFEQTADDDIDEGLLDKGSVHEYRTISTPTTTTSAVASRGSKRVIAPAVEDQPTRLTRKKSRQLSSTEGGLGGGTLRATTPEAYAEDAIQAPDCPATVDDQIGMPNEDEVDHTVQVNRGRSMGKDLERMSRGLCSRIPVHVVEGKKRPEAPIQAAKLASEGGIILRQHFPILPHWKEYKKDQSLIQDYLGKVGGHFTMDINNKAVTDACSDILKSGQRQMRYKLKKKFFDGVPANKVRTTSPLNTMSDEHWRDLVSMWSDPKHLDWCMKNKENHEKVQLQQMTGSRCYIAHCHAVKQEKYKDVNPTALDLFKACHFSNKRGYSEPVKKAIADMEAKLAELPQDGQEPKSPSKVVSEVLPNSKFLTNMGIESAAPKRSTKPAVAARVQELETELESEKQGSARLQDKVDTQQEEMDDMKKKMQVSDEEIAALKKSSEETNSLLRRLLSLNKV